MVDRQYRYIALVRGINVGGHAAIKMADLRAQFEAAGATDVTSYIQSGNILLTLPSSNTEPFARTLEQQMQSSVGPAGKIFILTPAQLREAAASNPFAPKMHSAESECHLMFLSTEPDADRREALMAMQGDEYRFAFHGSVLYYAYPLAVRGTRRTINFEKVLDVTGTARNWRVVERLIQLTS